MKSTHAGNDALLIHEALHMACFLMKSVDAELLEHPAIKGDAHWSRLADTAHQALFDLYQAIGRHDDA
jgi:hypothetical protein